MNDFTQEQNLIANAEQNIAKLKLTIDLIKKRAGQVISDEDKEKISKLEYQIATNQDIINKFKGVKPD